MKTKRYIIEFINNPVQEIGNNHNKKGKTLIVVNTVGKSQRVYESIVKTNYEEYGLIHASKIFKHRLKMEDYWVEKFGKNSKNADLLLVGTQILEQSLDIDADHLITELCPIDVLFQRSGRQHRHVKQRDDVPIIYLSTPLFEYWTDVPKNKKDLEIALSTSKFSISRNVYDSYLLLMTYFVLRDHINRNKYLTLPQDIRVLINKVYNNQDINTLDFIPPQWKEIMIILQKYFFDKKGILEIRGKNAIPNGFNSINLEDRDFTRLINLPTHKILIYKELKKNGTGDLNIKTMDDEEIVIERNFVKQEVAKSINENAVTTWLKESVNIDKVTKFHEHCENYFRGETIHMLKIGFDGKLYDKGDYKNLIYKEEYGLQKI